MSIRIKDYHHMAIVVRNLEKCRWFYGDVLGLQTIERPPFDFPGHWYQVGRKTQLHLMVFNEPIPATMRHLAIEVEDFDETVQTLETEGIKIVDGPGKRVDGSDYLFCNDPDGNLIEITKH
ncbi:MAG: glyoxalase [Proteobacteria bacterium]|nr:glyoxalase [Pseudomonadota bacterium]NIS69261.1 glyoxalase [Pseudomonadota bacterium]